MEKPVKNIPNVKQVTIVRFNDVKSLLVKGADDDNDDHRYNDAGNEKNDEHHHHGDYSVHLQLPPETAQAPAVVIHGKLVEFTPQGRAKLNANLKGFEVQLAATDKQIGNELAPLRGKGYFVFYGAYGYYGKHYGLTLLGHFTVNPEIQSGVQRLHEIRIQSAEQRATCVFTEPQFKPAIVEAAARGTSIRMGTLDPLGTNIKLGKTSYSAFLNQLTSQYASCLKED